MRLYFDTETTGLPDMYEIASHPAQPNLVSLAAILVDEEWNERAVFSAIVKPEGWTIPAPAAKIHGITTKDAERFGYPRRFVVAAFINLLRRADGIGAHNLAFDERIVNTAALRVELTAPWPYDRVCTQEIATKLLKLPRPALAAGNGQYKWASIRNCTRHFFRREPTNAHNALGDTRDAIAIHRRIVEGGRRDPWWQGVLRG